MFVRRSFLALDAKGGVIRNKSQRKIQTKNQKKPLDSGGDAKKYLEAPFSISLSFPVPSFLSIVLQTL